jgi:hypothetical protein
MFRTLKLSLATIGVMVSLQFHQPLQAQGGIPVVDGSNLSRAILDGVEQAQQQIVLINQFNQLVQSYEQELQNALSLRDVGLAFDLRGLIRDLVYSDLGATVFSTVYGLNPRSPTYSNDVISILRDEYGIPTSNGELEASLRNHYSNEDFELVQPQITRNDRDTQLLESGFEITANAKTASVELESLIDLQQSAIEDLPANSLQQAVTHNGRATIINTSVNKAQLDLDIVRSEVTLQQEARRLEQEERRLRQRVSELEARQRLRQAPAPTFESWREDR